MLVHFKTTLWIVALVGGVSGSEFVGLAVGTSGDEVGEDFIFELCGVGLCPVDDVLGKVDDMVPYPQRPGGLLCFGRTEERAEESNRLHLDALFAQLGIQGGKWFVQ